MALAAFTFKLAAAALPMPRTAKLDRNERREKTVPQLASTKGSLFFNSTHITSSLIHRRAHLDTERRRQCRPLMWGNFDYDISISLVSDLLVDSEVYGNASAETPNSNAEPRSASPLFCALVSPRKLPKSSMSFFWGLEVREGAPRIHGGQRAVTWRDTDSELHCGPHSIHRKISPRTPSLAGAPCGLARDG
jgi:hypothetical protein